MKTKFIEATQNKTTGGNWGKFMLAYFDDEEWARKCSIPSDDWLATPLPLLQSRGWTSRHLLVLDIETGEGALFLPGGYAKADLDKHKVWVCPMFEPFLTWLYTQDLSDLDALPSLVELPDAEFAVAGYRRNG